MGGLDRHSDSEQSEQAKSITEVMASLELPWPTDVFGEVPKDDWSKIDDFAKTLGYRIDTISGDLMRRGWKVYERLLRERVNDLVADGFVITTDLHESAINTPKGNTREDKE